MVKFLTKSALFDERKIAFWRQNPLQPSCNVFVGRSRRSGVGRADGLQGARCNPHQADYHLTFGTDVHHHSPTKSTVVAATLPSPCSGGGGGPEQSCGSENDYFRTWQLQRHVSCPATTATVTAVRTAGIGRPAPTSLRLLPAGGGGGHASRRPAPPEHIYESPRLERRELVPPSAECTCCEPPRRGSTDLLATTCPDSTQQSPIQYYELDQSARPVHV